MYYSNAPLIEVIAELRWRSQHASEFENAGPFSPVQVTSSMIQRDNEFFDRFSDAVFELGFRYVERLVPADHPSLPGQVALRYRQRPGVSPLLQVGAGVFTANGLPPEYRGWTEFLSTVSPAIEQLIAIRPPEEAEEPFAVSLRYLDAFKPAYWGDRTAGDFISKVLGYEVSLPTGAVDHVDSAGTVTAAIEAQIPLSRGRRLQVKVGSGTANEEPAVVLDLVAFEDSVDSVSAVVLDSLEGMHIIHSDMFRDVANRLGPALKEEK